MADNNFFPAGKYTPFGYLDNPYHTAILNQSGVLRSVPPLGFGFWVRDLPWPYGNAFGLQKRPGYLSFLQISLRINDVSLARPFDFKNDIINLHSAYHTKNVFSYDFVYQDVSFNIKYLLDGENALVCIVSIDNTSDEEKSVKLYATNVYGYPRPMYWGSDGLVAGNNDEAGLGISKVWAYGDVFAIGSNVRPASSGVTSDDDEWLTWVTDDEPLPNNHETVRFGDFDHLNMVEQYVVILKPGDTENLILALVREKTEEAVINEHKRAVKNAGKTLSTKLGDDRKFYQGMPILEGDWPQCWKNGQVYDYETLRMTIRPPIGIYKHPWDGMQIHTPRVVLGETTIDCMSLSYVDPELAKEVIFGTFADAPAPNIPCSREDGSMNMICASGEECGTAPIWGMPFTVINSIYLRDRDDEWIKKLYPYLKAYLEWWLEYRTDAEGWFHAACSWESGQDGSKRFIVEGHDPGAASAYVRTVDIEAAMAASMKYMISFAEIAGESEDVRYWQEQSERRVISTISMYEDGWFRDVDNRTNEVIILDDYFDVMMMTPAAVGIATADQMKGMEAGFKYFIENPRHWLEWPSFLQVYSEAAWNAGQRMLLAELLGRIANRVYPRLDRRELFSVGHFDTDMPEKYNYRIPGVSNEFWPLELYPGNPGGAENYGWGATFPALLIRNLIGFREIDDHSTRKFHLAPAFPKPMLKDNASFGISNLNFCGAKLAITYTAASDDKLVVQLKCASDKVRKIEVLDEEGNGLAEIGLKKGQAEISFNSVNGGLYTVVLD